MLIRRSQPIACHLARQGLECHVSVEAQPFWASSSSPLIPSARVSAVLKDIALVFDRQAEEFRAIEEVECESFLVKSLLEELERDKADMLL